MFDKIYYDRKMFEEKNFNQKFIDKNNSTKTLRQKLIHKYY